MRKLLGAAGALGALALAPAAALALDSSATSGTAPTVSVSGSEVTVSGHYRPGHGVVHRGPVTVQVQLDGIDHAYERHSTRLSAADTYTLSWHTRLTGQLRVVVTELQRGRPLGRSQVASVTVAVPTTTTPARTVTVTVTQTSGTAGTAPAGTPLLGLFKLQAGSAPTGAAPTGTFVELLSHSGGVLTNVSSPSPNKDYTVFSPGTDGGLSTVAYEPSPSPAFSNGTSGNALANEIVEPVGFEGYDFSISTQAKDAQTGQSDPIPQIYDDNGTLSGQITAWDAQWNGESFNQGTPKPDGTLPAPTTPISGTYDSTTGAFTITWHSAIVGGPFNGYSGYWHLQGTFVPASP